MIFALIFSLIGALVVVSALVLELGHVRRSFATALDLVLSDRDLARKEVETLRAALFPQLARIAASQPGAGSSPAAPSSGRSSRVEPKAGQPAGLSLEQLFPPRVSWRILFKQKVRQHNTQQRGRDLHAAAIAQAKDTPHAS